MERFDPRSRTTTHRPASGLTVLLVGGPTAVLELGGLRLLTDPTFSPAGVHESAPGRLLTKTEDPALGIDSVGAPDVVLLSHDQHADNLDPAGRELLMSSPLTLTTESGAQRLGGTARGLASWHHVTVPRPDGSALEITAVPARHGPEGCEPLTGDVTGFVLRGEGLPTVYVSGDNAAVPIVRDIAKRIGAIDVALLFAGAARTSLFDGQPLTLTSADAASAARVLDARWVVPLHVRGWAHFTEGPVEVQAAFERADLADRLCTLAPGQSVTFQPARGVGATEARWRVQATPPAQDPRRL